jgi:hypothetical protein
LVRNSHSISARWRKYFSQLFSIHGVSDVRQTELQTAEPLMPEPNVFEVEMAIEKLNRHRSPGIVQITSELIKAEGRIICYEIHQHINSILSKEELPEQWKESNIVPNYEKGDKTDCSNYTGISLLSTTYKLLSVILMSGLTPYAEEIIADHKHGFRRNRSTTDHIFCVGQILEKTNGNNMKQRLSYL